ncbi:MAG TPA: 4-hydroxythreonine-4-phosphate dehydrogenase PdxA [Verrucomicrobiota bacterium]|nr:4-hydroxythreonine-4-phosphate dehydrogenase PdxA [Verrucomicrobiota bacterium]
MTGRIGITLGDITGIGPEVALKAIAAEAETDDVCYHLIGDGTRLRHLNAALGLNLPLQTFHNRNQHGRFFITNPFSEPLPATLPSGAPAAANAAVACLKHAGELCMGGELDAMVTGPVNKESIVRAGHRFIGQTEFLTELARAERTVMMLLGHDEHGRWLRVALATIHIAIREVPIQLTTQKILLAIVRAAEACRLLQLPRARVAVCGLNPHCGEGGEFGDEEPRVIEPAVAEARSMELDVIGPLSGDTVFHHALRGEFDAVVAMYHDQGLAPLKAVAFDTGVNWTLGLPFIRTSPDHGTAYNIAGQGIANPSSMISAIRLAKQLSKSRG